MSISLTGCHHLRPGYGTDFWPSGLLLFGVDGRARAFDLNTANYPDVRADYKNADQARVDARQFLHSTPAFLEALRQFGGFRKAELVVTADGLPVVG